LGLLLAFAPFIAFAVFDRLTSSSLALWAGAATSALLLLRDVTSRGRKTKVLEVGTMLLFSGLAIYASALQPDWSIVSVRLRVDAGLLLIVLVTILIRRPFTLQYAREQAPREVWESSEFIRVNYVISAVWAAAFAAMVAADLLLVYRTDLPPRIGIIITILALVGAFKFTQWYPERNATARAR
jgi:hypothetical protein